MKFLSLFAAFLLCVAAWAEEPEPVTSGTCGAKLTWNYDTESKTLAIAGSGAMYDYSDVVPEWRSLDIDALVIGEGVTTIGDKAFDFMFCINSVSFPSTLSSIGAYAFRYARMSTLAIPEGVRRIGKYAFATCPLLTSVSLPSTLGQCGGYVFQNCQELTQVTFATGIQAIGSEYMFMSCKKLESVTIPESVNDLANGVFANSGVKNMVIPEGVMYIPDYLFSMCGSLESVTLPSTTVLIDTASFNGCAKLASLIIPDGVTTIRERAFAECSLLENIVMPSSLTTLGGNVFYQTKVQEVTLPASVTTMGDAFAMSRVETLTMLTDVPPTFEGETENPFYFGVQEMVVRVPKGSASAYLADPMFSKAESIVEFDTTAIKTTFGSKEPKAMKTIENGKVVIVKDGVKYDLSGSRL